MSISAHSFKLNMDLKSFKKETGLAAADFKMLRREVANTKTPLEKMQSNIDKATIAYKKGAISGEAYRRMLAKLNAEQKKAAGSSGSKLGKLKKEVMSLGTSMTGLSASSLTAVGAFAAVGTAGVKMIGMIKDEWEELNSLAKFSDATGFSENFVVSFQSAAKYATDMNSDQVSTSLKAFTRNLGILASTGTGEAAPALELLHLGIDDLMGLNADEQLKAVADEFAGLSTHAEKSAVAVKLFGEQGQAMIPMLEGGAEALNAFQDAAERRGLTHTADELATIQENMDRLAYAEEEVGVFKKGFAMEAAHSFDVIADMLGTINIKMEDFGSLAFKLVSPFLTVVTALGDMKARIAEIQLAESRKNEAGNTWITGEAGREREDINAMAGGIAGMIANESTSKLNQTYTVLEQIDQKIVELQEKYGQYGDVENEITNLKKQRAELIQLSADTKKLNEEKAAAAESEAKVGGADALAKKYQQELDLFGIKGRDLELAKLRNEAFKEERLGHDDVAKALRQRLSILEELDSQLDKKETKEQEAAKAAKDAATTQAEADRAAAKSEADKKKAVADIRESMKTDEQKFQDDVKAIRDLTGGPLGLTDAEAEAAIEKARAAMKKPIEAKAEAEINMSFSMKSKNGLDVSYAGSSYDPSEFVTTSRDVTSNSVEGTAIESRDYLKIIAEKEQIKVEVVQSL